MRDLGERPRGRILQRIYEKNAQMNAQMPFSCPLFPELGSPPPFNFLDPPQMSIWNKLFSCEIIGIDHTASYPMWKKYLEL